MFVSHHTPNSISLDGSNFILTLSNKKFLDEELKIDSSSDYVDIYLQSQNSIIILWNSRWWYKYSGYV